MVGGRSCGACGQMADGPSARFCASCGAALGAAPSAGAGAGSTWWTQGSIEVSEVGPGGRPPVAPSVDGQALPVPASPAQLRPETASMPPGAHLVPTPHPLPSATGPNNEVFVAMLPEDVSAVLAQHLTSIGASITVQTPSSVGGTMLVKGKASLLVALVLWFFCIVPMIMYLVSASKDRVESFSVRLVPEGHGVRAYVAGTALAVPDVAWVLRRLAAGAAGQDPDAIPRPRPGGQGSGASMVLAVLLIVVVVVMVAILLLGA